MQLSRFLWFLSILTYPVLTALAGDAPVRHDWKVNGTNREALIYAPPSATNQASPVIFAFHGHGGSMQNAARMFGCDVLWPEAIVVYMQGLNTPGKLTDLEGKRPGWQFLVGEQGDRDLKFFDTVLAELKRDYKVDGKRIYATGHSNGGAFTYLLWSARGDQLAAVAPPSTTEFVPLKPKPVLHIAGEKDPLVKFELQKETMANLRKLNQCGKGEPWEKVCTLYPSKIGAPVVTFIHPGTHQFPTEAQALVIKFFQQHAKP